MTSKELLYVKTIAEEKSISQAAKLLFIAQPSLSQALARIEENLGTPLFTRTTNGLCLTYAGERYYQAACRILKIYENLEGEISDINGLRTGRIRMGITNHLGTVILPRVLPIFRRQCPFIELDILEETTDKLENHLLSGQMDFALMHAPKENSHPLLNYEFLANDPFVIAMSPDHPLSAQAEELDGYAHPVLDPRLLKNEPFIMLHTGQRIRHITDAILKKARIEPKIALTLRNYETAQALVSHGMGVTLLPEDYTRIILGDNPPAFFSIHKKYDASWDMCITSRKDGELSRADEFFLEILKSTQMNP